jgi:hypothetical protein
LDRTGRSVSWNLTSGRRVRWLWLLRRPRWH